MKACKPDIAEASTREDFLTLVVPECDDSLAWETLLIAVLASTMPADTHVATVLDAPESLSIVEVATERLSVIVEADAGEALESLCTAS